MKTIAIIVAGGEGKRMGKPKQFLPILGKPMIEWTIEAFKKVKEIDEIILVVSKENLKKAKKLGVRAVSSGCERTDSVRGGLKLVPADTDIVLIHDGARPLVTAEMIKQAIDQAKKFGAIVVGVPVKDTVKMTNECLILKTLDRRVLWLAQTPQAFRYDIIKRAYDKAKSSATDDSKLVENLGIKVKMIMGSYDNIKITTPEDVIIAEALLKR